MTSPSLRIRLRSVCPLLFVAVIAVWTAALPAQERTGNRPATADEASRVIDLRRFPRLEGATFGQRTRSGCSGEVPGKVPAIYETVKRQLTADKWVELPQSYVSDQAASAVFSKSGFRVSVSVYSTGTPNLSVMLVNHGNVDLKQLPVPTGAKTFVAGPVSQSYLTAEPTDATRAALDQQLVAQGWEPYGSAGDVSYFKQNAVRIGARVSTAPAQGNKTLIDFTSEQLSVDLPAPASTERLQYSDAPCRLTFETAMPLEELEKFYLERLITLGWTATTERAVRSGSKSLLIFRNAAKDLLTLETAATGGKQRVSLVYESADELAELAKRAKAFAEKQKQGQTPPADKFRVELPAGAKAGTLTKNRVEFQVGTGRAKDAVEMLRKSLGGAGWKETQTQVEAMFGLIMLEKGSQSLTINYIDPGLIPAEVTITSTGLELEIAK